MKRSAWKLPYIAPYILKRINNKFVKLKKRNSVIPTSFIDKKVSLYNGIWNLSFIIKPDMRGHVFGEYSWTKRATGQLHIRRKTKKKSKKK